MKIIYTLLLIISTNFAIADNWEYISDGFNNNAFYLKTFNIYEHNNDIYINTQDNGIFKTDKDLIEWEYIGLSNQIIHKVCIFEDNLFAATIDGLFFTNLNTDLNWQKTTDLTDKIIAVYDIVKHDNNLYVGGTKGIFKSTDKGVTWALIGLENLHIRSIKIIDDTIYVGTDDFVYISYDKGDSWVGSDDYSAGVKEIYYDGETIYLGKNYGAFYSEDKGKTWNKFDFYDYKVSGFTQMNGRIIAATDNGIYYSDDRENWKNYKFDKFSNIVNDVYTIDDKVYACSDGSFYYSTDMGESWVQKFPSNRVEHTYLHQGKLYILTDYNDMYIGDFTLEEENVNWTHVEILPEHKIFSLCFDKNKIYAGTLTGLYLSEDGGYSWSLFAYNNKIVTYVQIYEDRLFASVNYDGTYYSTDNGQKWIKSSPPELGFNFILKGDNYYFASTRSYGDRIYYSLDKGDTWEGVKNFNWGYALSVEIIDDVIYFGTKTGAYKTNNFGNTWDTIITDNRVSKLIFYNDILYARISYSMPPSYSTDKGKTWTNMDLPSIGFNDLAFGNKYMYAATHLGLFRKKLFFTDVQEFSNEVQEFLVYPNPASDYIEISINKPSCPDFIGAEGSEIAIYDVLGNKVISVETRHALSLQRIDISHLPRGVYFVRIGERVEKFVKL